MVVPLPPSPLSALVDRVDAEVVSTDGEHPDQTARHKALVRAAGRAAIEQTLNSQPVAELTAESLAAEWLAYAEVFGTNGMVAGGGRSSTGDLPAVQQPGSGSSSPTVEEPHESWQRGIGMSILAAVLLLLVATTRYPRGIKS